MRRASRQATTSIAIPTYVVIAILAALIGTGVAWAHPQIISMEPPANARLEAPPARLRVMFDEPLETISTLVLRDSQGQEVASGGAPLPQDLAILALDLPLIDPGVYTMVWTVVGDDGHIVKGNAAFSVLGGGAASAPTPEASVAPEASAAPEAEPLPLTAMLLRGLMLIGAAAGVGGLAFLVGLLGPALASAGAPNAALRRGQAWLAAPLLLCAAAAALMIFVQADAALGRADLRGASLVVGTRYGAVLLARASLAAILAGVVALPGQTGRLRDGVALAIGGSLLISFSLGGHAAAAQSPLLPVLADVIHIGVTALWVGGLLTFAITMPTALRAVPEGHRPSLLRALFSRFSTLALASVALLTLTGAYAALRLLGSLSDLLTTPYGLSLLAKLLAFGGMLIFGAYNLLVARPGLERWAARTVEAALARPWPHLIGRSLRAEAALGLVALLAAGALTSLAPPTEPVAAASRTPPTPTAIQVPTATPGPTRTPVPSLPFDETQAAGDLRVRLEVDPASIGDDRFTVTVTDQAGDAVETQRVRLRFEMLEMDMGENELIATPEAQASYEVIGAPMSMVGDWQITVTVRRAGVNDVEAVFTVPVGE